MAQTDPKRSKSLKELLQERRGASSFESPEKAKAEELEKKLQERERELEAHKKELEELKKEQESAKIEAKPEEPIKMRERKVEEKEEEAIKEVSEEQKALGKAAQAKKAAVKKGIADDIAVLMDLDEPKQVKALAYIALQKGIHHAYTVAKGLNSPYILDEFHSVMAVKMRKILVEKGQLPRVETQDENENK